jgi:4-hydroxy-3-methylbut-2-en-1-yl diphosphate reductase
VLLAEPRGFCAGVEKAIKALAWMVRVFEPPVYCYHEIVHNRHVVQRFRRRGAIFVADLEQVPEGAPLLFSAHGVSPAVRQQARQRRLRTIDATCPLVTKVHLEVIRFARQNYTIVLIGQAGHDEVVGTLGEAPNHIYVVGSVADVEGLAVADEDRVAYLTQTTLSRFEAEPILAALRQRFPSAVSPATEDMCYASQNRQAAVEELLAEADVVLVFGSQNSHNSQRLRQRAAAAGKPAYLLDDVRQLRIEWFAAEDSVLVTAGASCPEDVVLEGVAALQDHFGAVVENRVVREEHIRFALPRVLP